MHLYDVGANAVVTGINKVFRPLGTGAFHGAVEVYGQEYSFGYCDNGSGVFGCPPKGCDAHAYRESIAMGETNLTESQSNDLIKELSAEWPGSDYDLLKRNCCTFSDVLCVKLGVGHIPPWVNNLAGAGATLHDGFKQAATQTEAIAIVAAAKANQVNEKYQIEAKTKAKATEIYGKTLELDGKYGVSDKSKALVTKANTKVMEIDAKHNISGKAKEGVAKAAAAVADLDAKHDISGKTKEGLAKGAEAVGGLLKGLSASVGKK